MTCRLLLPAMLLAAVPAMAEPPGEALNIRDFQLVDLTHTFDDSTIYWPTSPSTFQLEQLNRGPTPGGWFYASNALCTPEHGGTHLDAPVHFAEGRRTTEQIPLDQLVAPAVVLDITAQCVADRDYRLSEDDVLEFERRHGQIEPGTIVLLRTGWSHFWPNREAYLGDDTPGDASKLSFPSFGEKSVRLLVEERGIAALGVDTASLDVGRSKDFIVHRIVAERNVPGFENLTNLDRLQARGSTLIALPMKIKGGSGGPLRAIALVPR